MRDIPLASVNTIHHIQREVLIRLRQQTSMSYIQLKPDGLEGNAFNYHLKNLKQSKLISLNNGRYSLTPLGQIVTESYSLEPQRMMLRPHFYTYLLITSQNKILLYKPTRQPIPGIYTLPSGKLHYGDSFDNSIAREILRRNLTNDYSARSLCAMNLIVHVDGQVTMQRAGFLWIINYSGPLNVSKTANGIAEWLPIDTLDTNPIINELTSSAIKQYSDNLTNPIEINIYK